MALGRNIAISVQKQILWPNFITQCAVVYNVWRGKGCHNRSLMLSKAVWLQSCIVCGVYSGILGFPQFDFFEYFEVSWLTWYNFMGLSLKRIVLLWLFFKFFLSYRLLLFIVKFESASWYWLLYERLELISEMSK